MGKNKRQKKGKFKLMDFIYFKSKTGNFGDDLNGWLWPKLFHDMPENNAAFIGIGSILFNENKIFEGLNNRQKIVFGTGIRPTYKEKFKVDETWDIRFLRGPLSAKVLSNKYQYITDAAYALRLIPEFEEYKNLPKKYKISVIPYFHSKEYIDIEAICKKLDFNYISPFSELGVEHTIREIASSEFIITEAMHGAIIADALRVPWNRFVLTTPYTEGGVVSEFKWIDWISSINLHYPPPTYMKFMRGNRSSINKAIQLATGKLLNVEFFFKSKVIDEVTEKLSKVNDYNLSEDSTINTIDSRIHDEVMRLRERKF